MKINFLQVAFALLMPVTVFCNENWLNISTPVDITEMKYHNNKLYITSKGGLVVYNIVNQSIERHFKTEGFLSNRIEDIEIDANENIWIGTYDNGVAKFDGSTWTNYPISQVANSGLLLYAIALDANEHLWAGTNQGMYKLENNLWVQKSFSNTWDVYADKQGNIFCASFEPCFIENDSVKTLNGSGLVIYSNATIAAKNNAIYFAGQNALSVYDGNSWTEYEIDANANHLEEVTDLFIDENNKLWIVMGDFGVYSLQNNTITQEINGSQLSVNGLREMCFINNNLVMGADNTLLIENSTNNYTTIDLQYKNLIENNIIELGVENGDIVTRVGNMQIQQVNVDSFIFNNSSAPLNNGATWQLVDVFNTNEPAYICGSTAQLFYNNTLINLNINPADLYPINDAFIDSENNLWICNYAKFYKINNGIVETFSMANTPFTDDGYWLARQDNNGDIWINGSDQMAKYSNGAWTEFYDAPSLGWPFGGAGADMYFDENNLMYFAGWYGGLVTFDGTTWTTYFDNNSNIPSNQIYDIDMYDGKIALATNSGLAFFDGTDFNTYNMHNSGLNDDKCNAIRVDKNNNLWIATNFGLSVYNKDGIEIETPTGILDINNENIKVSLYPNPCVNFITIEAEEPINEILIYNILGERVLTKIAENKEKNEINISQLNRGFYLVNIKTNKGATIKKIIVEK